MPPRKRKEETDGASPAVTKKKKGAAANGDAEPISEDETDSDFKLEGSLITGELLFAGGTNWDLIGRHKTPAGVKDLGGRNLWSPHRIEGFVGKTIRTIVSGCLSCHSVVIDTEGTCYTWGRNDKAQLGHGDTKRRDVPTVVETLSGMNIVDAACGKTHTLFLAENGRVYAVGDNKLGQLGLGNQGAPVPSPTRIRYKGPPIRKIAAAGEHSLILDIKGNVWSFGSPEYGQLGHNTDGQYFVSANKMGYNCEMVPRRVSLYIEKTRENNVIPVADVEVIDIACGMNHNLALDRKKRVYSWGFGGYGRLGHAEQKDEWIPRLIKWFDGTNRGAKQVYCGSAYSMAVNELGCLLLWGQNKPTGEAAMYPKPVQDLSGWKIRSIGCCFRSIVVAADDSVISWGPSPTYGELGYGSSQGKSSTQPKEVKPLNDVHVQKVACGFGHCLYLARTESEEDQKALEKLPLFEPENK